jgi:hypothetical protein
MNPPYGRGIERWMRKLAAHGDGIALVHSRTDTAWWRDAIASATALCFVAGRVRFVRGSTMSQEGPGSPVSSVLIAYGLACGIALAQAGLGPTLIVPRGLQSDRAEPHVAEAT